MGPGNQLDTLFDFRHPGPGSRALRLARHRAKALANTLRLAAAKSPHYRRHHAETLSGAASILEAGPQISNSQSSCFQGSGPQKPGEPPSGAPPPLLEDPAAWESLTRSVLASLPLTSESQVAESPESFLACGQSDIDGAITVPSSGSSGPSKRIFSTSSDLEDTMDFYRHGMLHLVAPGDKVALLMSGERRGSVGFLLSRALSRWDIPVKVMGPAPNPLAEDWLKTLEAFSPTCLVGLPSQIFLLSRKIGPPGPVKSILLSGEAAPKALRAAVSKAWGVKVLDHYGQTETGLAGAVECPLALGPHLREGELIAEIMGMDGTVLPPGESGELILTTLSRRAMPLIRYKTGDLARVNPEPCPCGSSMTRMEFLGRAADVFNSGAGEMSLSGLGEALYALGSLAGFRAALRPGPLLKVYVIPLNALPSAKEEAVAAAATALEKLLGGRPRFEVEAAEPHLVPASSGEKPTLRR